MKREVLANPSPVRQLSVLLDTLAEPVRVDVDAVWLESWSLGRRNPALGDAVRAEEGAWHTFVAAVVRRGVKAGDYIDVDPDEVAAHLLAVIDGVNAYSLVGYRTDLDRLRLLHAVARTHLGTRVRPGRRSARRRLIAAGHADRVLARFLDLLAGLQARTPPDAEFLYDAGTPDGALRLANLRRYLELRAGATTLLVGEAPGWRGATVTGVPFMSVRELTARPGLLTGRPGRRRVRGARRIPRRRGSCPPPSCRRRAASWAGAAACTGPSTRTTRSRAPDRCDEPRAAGAGGARGRPDRGRAGAGARHRAGRRGRAGRPSTRSPRPASTATAVRHPAQGGAALFAAQMAELGRDAA